MLSNGHGGFGKRPGETGRSKDRHRASGRLRGGYDNFAADRIAALKVAEAAPEVPVLARENRKFLRRAVRCLVPVPQWRPDEPGSADSGKPWLLAGLGRKPG